MQPFFTRKINRLLLCLLLVMPALPAFASHFAAADLYVDYIGSSAANLKYKVTLTIYKACEAGNTDLYASEPIKVSSANLNASISRTIYPVAATKDDTLDQLCANFASINSCRSSNGVWPGYVRRIYADTITVPAAATDWKIIWDDGNRNGGIINLDQPSSQDIYVECLINNTGMHYNNSTPRYGVPPIPYLCINQPSQFFDTPSDPNGDSLVTINLNPLGANGIVLGYTTPYTLAAPLPVTSTGYVVDAGSGTALFTPTAQGKYVVAFRTFKYDRATHMLLGYTSRDVQLTILNCNASFPAMSTYPISLTGGTTQPDGSVLGFPGTPISFDITANTTAGNTLVMHSNNASAAIGSTFTQNVPSAGSIIGHFAWTPAMSDIGTHVVTVSSVDTTCNSAQPIVQSSYQAVTLRIIHTLGVSGNSGAEGIAIYPLPAQDILYLDAHGTPIESASILTITGQPVGVYLKPGAAVNVASLAPGNYLLKITTARSTSVARFVKE